MYMVLMMSPCALVCGVVMAMNIRIEWCVWYVIDLLTHTTMWIEVPLMPIIYTMLQEALLFNLQIMIQDLSILTCAEYRPEPVSVTIDSEG